MGRYLGSLRSGCGHQLACQLPSSSAQQRTSLLKDLGVYAHLLGKILSRLVVVHQAATSVVLAVPLNCLGGL